MCTTRITQFGTASCRVFKNMIGTPSFLWVSFIFFPVLHFIKIISAGVPWVRSLLSLSLFYSHNIRNVKPHHPRCALPLILYICVHTCFVKYNIFGYHLVCHISILNLIGKNNRVCSAYRMHRLSTIRISLCLNKEADDVWQSDGRREPKRRILFGNPLL